MTTLGARSAKLGKVSKTAVLVWSLVSFAGCSAIAGLDGIQEQGCAPNCGSTGDAKAPQDSSVDTGSIDSSPGNDSSMGDTSTPHDSGMPIDTGGGQDSGLVDTGTVVDAPPFDDAPFDSGCGDLNTTDNCSACGDKCASVNNVQTSAACCSGSTCPGSTDGTNNSCAYTCATGYLDCDGPAGTNPPNLNGCECHAPGATQAQCCAAQGGDCPIQHNNGLTAATSPAPAAITFWDCFPTCTTSSCMAQVAQDACVAFVGAANAAQCQPYGQADSSTPDSYCNGGNNDTAVNGDCICWTFAGQWAGTFLDPKQQGLTSPQNCYYGGSSGTFH